MKLCPHCGKPVNYPVKECARAICKKKHYRLSKWCSDACKQADHREKKTKEGK